MTLVVQIVVACLLILGVGLTSAGAQMEIGTLKKGVAKITTEFSNTRKVGTGFIAAKGKKHLYIVTASHVVEGETEVPKAIRVTFFTHQEETIAAKIVKKEGGDPQGLALLKVKGDLLDDVQILSWDATTQVSGGEEIHLIGFPRVGGNPWAVTKGTLSGFDGSVLKFSGAVAEGNSGGPVLYQGRVIGVVMEVTGQFGNAKPAQIAKFTVENWPGFPRIIKTPPDPPEVSDKAPMVLIPAGEFWMGSSEDESRSKDELPRHKVFLDRFYLDIFEVTTEQYAQFMSAADHPVPEFWDQVVLSRDKTKPVVGVSWQDAKDFCEWAGKRLPTEAEWERAARGTDERKYPWGQEPPSRQRANFDQKSTTEKIYSDRLMPVGRYENGKSPVGVYDMAGNVWEWVADWYDKKYYGNFPNNNPKGPEAGEERVMRGGSWDDINGLRSADRFSLLPSQQDDSVGFRCAKDAS